MTVTSPAVFAHGMLNEQIADVSRQIEKAPQDQALRIRRAELHRVHDDYAAAKADLLAVLNSTNGPVAAALILARLEREHSHFKTASKYLATYFTRGGDAPEAHREKALIESALRRPRESAKAWREYLQRANSPTADEHHAAALAHVEAGSPENALEIIEDGLETFPRSIPLYYGAASILIELDKLPEAEAKFFEVKSLYPPLLPRLCFDEGLIWEAHRIPKKAKSAFQSAERNIAALPPAKQKSPGIRKLSALLSKKLTP